MALALKDRVQQTGTANTTVSFTLTGNVTGFQSFSTVGNGNTTYYTATDVSGNWEVGIGTYSTTGPTITRDTILSSSNSGSAVTFSGTVNIWVDYPAGKAVNLNADGVMEVGEPLGYSDTGVIATFTSTEAGYNQIVVQNKSSATNASANINISNDTSTSTTGFAELGINSSTFTGSGAFNIPSAAYLASAGTDLSIGTYSAHDIHFVTNSSTTDAMTIYDNGGTSLGAYGNPGIGNLAVNKIVSGVTTITASAGTTTLDAASTYYQVVVGTTTQTIQLPDATTLLNGTTFIIDNDSTGNVTVTDNASASLDIIPAGGISYLYLSNNSTVAGSWTAHGFLPSIYNFNNSTADFANATITNAVWNGTAISPAYGGTGLSGATPFSAANNALYSSGANTLTAGTLPVAAGGTGNTSGQAASVANALSAGTGLSYTSGTTFDGSAARTLNLANTAVSAGSYTNASLTVDAQGRLTAASSGTVPVTSVTATSPVVSSGGVTPDISMPAATTSVSGYLTSTDWNTFNNKFGQGADIPSGVDLNSYTTTGWYHQNANAGAAAGTNYPVALAGLLEVYTDGSMTYQRYTVYNSGIIYTRSKYISTWYAWRLEIDSLNISSYAVTSVSGTGGYGGLTLSGTVTSSGNITLGGTPTGTWPIDISGNANSATTATTATTATNQSGGTVSATTGAFSGVASFAAGSAAAPAITRTGDTNTGIFFPAADTIAFTEGGTEAVRINSSGNVGIGTTSPAVSLDVVGTVRSTSVTIANAATITPTSNTTNQYTVTALAQAATIAVPSGTPIDGQKLTIRIKDNGTARALTWTTSAGGYRAIGVTLPTTTVASKVTYVGCIYNSQDSFWDVVAVSTQA